MRRLKAAEGFCETSEQLFAQLREELVEAALDDHKLVQVLLDELAALRMDDEAWNKKLEVLEAHVKDHVKEAEGDIFDVARQLFSAEQVAELAQRWQIAKQEYMARHAK